MIPEGWKFTTLETEAKVIDCKHRTPPYVEIGIPVISPGTIKWGEIDLDTPVKRVTYEEYESLMDHCTIEVGDMVLSRNQSVGVASYIKKPAPFVLGQDTVLVKPAKANSRFLFYYLQSYQTQKAIYRISGGSTFSRINLKDIRRLKLNAPPFSEQTEIANILSTWDKAIETVEQLIENSRAQKKALMQQLLTGKKRLPGFIEEWKNVQLSSIANITMGSSPKSEAYNNNNDGLPLIQGNADIKNRESVPRIFTSQITKTCRIDDVLLSVRAPVGEVSISRHHACIGRGIAALRAKPDSHTPFIYQFLLYKESSWSRLSQGSTFDCVNSSDIKGLHIFSPEDKSEKVRISKILETQDCITKNLNEQLERLKQQKKSLMQQLLTGKRRVKVNAADSMAAQG